MNPVDLYCERITPAVLGEPLNAATNAALLISAWFAWRYARQSGKADGGITLLVALMIAFGVGSTFFHTFANATTRWLDVLPIATFVATYLWLYARRVLQAPTAIATICTAAFVVAAAGARQFPDILNGSIIYAPALILVIGLGEVHLVREHHERPTLIAAAGSVHGGRGLPDHRQRGMPCVSSRHPLPVAPADRIQPLSRDAGVDRWCHRQGVNRWPTAVPKGWRCTRRPCGQISTVLRHRTGPAKPLRSMPMPAYRSRTATHGRNMAGARGLWRATGMKDSDFGKPIIAVVNSFTGPI